MLGGDVEMGDSKSTEPKEESQTVEINFIQPEIASGHCLEYQGQLMPDDASDGDRSSAGIQSSSELADTYHGL